MVGPRNRGITRVEMENYTATQMLLIEEWVLEPTVQKLRNRKRPLIQHRTEQVHLCSFELFLRLTDRISPALVRFHDENDSVRQLSHQGS